MADAIDTMGDDWLEEAGATPEAEPETPAAAPEPEAPADPEPAAEAATETVESDPQQVPLAALKEEREKRQALERKMAELESRVGQQQPQTPQAQRQKAPDPYEAPEEFAAHIEAQIAEAVWVERAERSGQRAEEKYGKETVEAALSWAQQAGDPALEYKVRAQASPVEYVVQEYQRSQTLQQLGGKSFEDAAREFAQSQGWIVSEPGAQAPNLKPSSPTPPKSLSQAPGNGGIGKAPKEADWTEVKFALG